LIRFFQPEAQARRIFLACAWGWRVNAIEPGAVMDHEQKHHEKHEQDRHEKQAHERQSEEQFSKPGPTIRPLWFLALGIILTMTALFIWWQI
jgi:hypothetical protein